MAIRLKSGANIVSIEKKSHFGFPIIVFSFPSSACYFAIVWLHGFNFMFDSFEVLARIFKSFVRVIYDRLHSINLRVVFFSSSSSNEQRKTSKLLNTLSVDATKNHYHRSYCLNVVVTVATKRLVINSHKATQNDRQGKLFTHTHTNKHREKRREVLVHSAHDASGMVNTQTNRMRHRLFVIHNFGPFKHFFFRVASSWSKHTLSVQYTTAHKPHFRMRN